VDDQDPAGSDPLDAALPADPSQQAAELVEQAVEADAAALTRDETEPAPDEQDLVRQWMDRTSETADFKAAVAQMEADLDAILGVAADVADASKVTVNHIYRNALQTTAMCVPEKHAVKWKPREEVDLVPGDVMPPQLMQQVRAEERRRKGFANVMRILVRRFCEEANFQETLEAWAQDAAHFRLAVLKFYYQRDLEGDPVSEERLPDEQDNAARMRVLVERFGRGEFTRSDAEFRQLLDLMTAQGKTEIARREGIVAELVPLTQYRCDPVVDGPENMRRASWHRHDVLMLRDDVLAKFANVKPEDLETQAQAYYLDTTGRAVKRDRIEKTQTANQAAQLDVNRAGRLGSEPGTDWYTVSEIYDLVTNHRLVLIEGLSYPVVNECAVNMPTGLVPFEVLVLNRVPGRLYGFSDTELQAKIQKRINWKRTEEEEARDASKPRWGYDPAVITDESAIQNVNEADPGDWVPVPVADKNKTLKDSVIPLHGNHEYNPAEYDTSKDEQELRKMSALPDQALGMTGVAKFSREVLAAQQGMNVMAKYRQARMARALKSVYSKIGQLLVFNVGPELAVRMAGPIAQMYWPAQPVDRQKVYDGLDIEVEVAMDSELDTAQQTQDLTALVEAGARAGAKVDPEVFTRILARLTGRLADVDDLFKPDPNALGLRLAEALQANPGMMDPQLVAALAPMLAMAHQQALEIQAAGAAPGAPEATAAGAPGPAGPPPAQPMVDAPAGALPGLPGMPAVGPGPA
jgi:hypothetical protein